MSTTEQPSFRRGSPARLRAGVGLLILAPLVAAIPPVAAAWQDSSLFELIRPAWWLVLAGPTIVVALVAVGVMILRREADAAEVFTEPASSSPEPPPSPPRVSVRTVRMLVVVAWVLAVVAVVVATTGGFGTALLENERFGAMFLAVGLALGAAFLDGGTATRRGTLTRWAVLRMIGVLTLPVYVGIIVLLIPAVWGLIRLLTGGATPHSGQRRARTLIGLLLSTLLITCAVVGTGRLISWAVLTGTTASSGIGVGSALDDEDEEREVVVVPYKLDGLPTYQARAAAISLEDGELLWDRKLDSDVWEHYPVAVTSFDRPPEDATDDTVVVTTEHGEFGFDLARGDIECGPDAALGECGIDPGQGSLADTGEPVGEGGDLYDRSPSGVDLTDIDPMAGLTNERFDTVLDPATGQPAGDGFEVQYNNGVRIVADERVIAELPDVRGLQQVLVAPSGTVVLLMHGDDRKSVVVVASMNGFQQTTIGDRGLVAWPAWMG